MPVAAVLQPELARSLSRRALIAVALLVLLALRIWFAMTLRVNSDEPQHLHVAWSWLQGALPYRDVFDNHAPLFQILHAPFLALFGERADIVPLMRLTVLPWYALTLWLIYRLGRALFDARIALGAAVIAALFPTFFIESVQFRPDTAWAAAWTAAVVVAVTLPPSRRRAFDCGLLAGLALALSVKSLMLFASAGVAAALVLMAWLGQRRRIEWRALMPLLFAGLAGAALLPAVIAAAFTLGGGGEAMRYCLFQHVDVSGLGRWAHPDWDEWLFPLSLPLLAVATWLWLKHARAPLRAAMRAWVFTAALLYLAMRSSYKPLLSKQDILPAVPMLAPFAAFLLCRLLARRRVLAFACIVAVEAAAMLAHDTPWRNESAAYRAELDDLLRLSTPADYVMDGKGEAIFRQRPSYWVLEGVTRYRIERGNINDDIPQSLADHAVGVGVFEELEGADRAFVLRNYVAVAPHVRVAGQLLGDARAGEAIGFEIAVPNRYAMVAEGQAARGLLDGSPYGTPRPLRAGHHVFIPSDDGTVAVLNARANELGYSPFGVSGLADELGMH